MATYTPTTYVPGAAAASNYAVTHQEIIGDKEDIADLIGLISPYDTPNYSQFRKTSAIQPVVQWQIDELRAPAANAVAEGFDVVQNVTANEYEKELNPGTLTGMRINYTQIFSETAKVSGTMLNTETYGRANELDYQIMKRGLEVRRDIEYALAGEQGDNAAGDAGGTDLARSLIGMQGLMDQVSTGVARGLTEAEILSLHEDIYLQGGDPNQMQVTPAHAVSVANFAYDTGRERDIQNETRLVNVVSMYTSPFGEMSVVTNKWMRGPNISAAADTSQVFLIEVDRWWLAELRPMTTEPLSKIGDAERRLITCELTVCHENPNASGYIEVLEDATTP